MPRVHHVHSTKHTHTHTNTFCLAHLLCKIIDINYVSYCQTETQTHFTPNKSNGPNDWCESTKTNKCANAKKRSTHIHLDKQHNISVYWSESLANTSNQFCLFRFTISSSSSSSSRCSPFNNGQTSVEIMDLNERIKTM